MANFIPAGANAVETSDIRTSGDVTVTDTQPGTVSDGEFLTNSGGLLTGDTVNIVPPWKEESGSPYQSSGSSAITISNIDDFDIYYVMVRGSSTSQDRIEMEVNNTNLDYMDNFGNVTRDTPEVRICQLESGNRAARIVTFGKDGKDGITFKNITPTDNNYEIAGGVTRSGYTLDRLKFKTLGANMDIKVSIYGVNV